MSNSTTSPQNQKKSSRMSKLCNSISTSPLKLKDTNFKRNFESSSRTKYSSLFDDTSPVNDTPKGMIGNGTTHATSVHDIPQIHKVVYESSTAGGGKRTILHYIKNTIRPKNITTPKKEDTTTITNMNMDDTISLLPSTNQEDSIITNDYRKRTLDMNERLKRKGYKSKNNKNKNSKYGNRIRTNTSGTSVTASFSSTTNNSSHYDYNIKQQQKHQSSSSLMFYVQQHHDILQSSFTNNEQQQQQYCNHYLQQPQQGLQPMYFVNNQGDTIVNNMFPPEMMMASSSSHRNSHNIVGISKQPITTKIDDNILFSRSPYSQFQFPTENPNLEDDNNGFYISCIETIDTASTLSFDSSTFKQGSSDKETTTTATTYKESVKATKKKNLEVRIPSFGNSSCGQNNSLVKVSPSILVQQQEDRQLDLEVKLQELLNQMNIYPNSLNADPNQNSTTTKNSQALRVHIPTPRDYNAAATTNIEPTIRQYFLFNNGSFASSYISNNPKNEESPPPNNTSKAVIIERPPPPTENETNSKQEDDNIYCSSSSSVSAFSSSSSKSSASSSSYCEDFDFKEFVESSPLLEPEECDSTPNLNKLLDFTHSDNDTFFIGQEEQLASNDNDNDKKEKVKEIKSQLAKKKFLSVLSLSPLKIKERDEDIILPQKTLTNSISTSSLTHQASSVFGVTLRSVNSRDTTIDTNINTTVNDDCLTISSRTS